MSKIKTKSGCKKRFRITANGKVKAGGSRRRHLMINKPKRAKRQSRNGIILHPAESRRVIENWMRNG